MKILSKVLLLLTIINFSFNTPLAAKEISAARSKKPKSAISTQSIIKVNNPRTYSPSPATGTTEIEDLQISGVMTDQDFCIDCPQIPENVPSDALLPAVNSADQISENATLADPDSSNLTFQVQETGANINDDPSDDLGKTLDVYETGHISMRDDSTGCENCAVDNNDNGKTSPISETGHSFTKNDSTGCRKAIMRNK